MGNCISHIYANFAAESVEPRDNEIFIVRMRKFR